MKYFKVLSNYHYILTALKSFFFLPPEVAFWIITLIISINHNYFLSV